MLVICQPLRNAAIRAKNIGGVQLHAASVSDKGVYGQSARPSSTQLSASQRSTPPVH
jgi:hypothetical protein